MLWVVVVFPVAALVSYVAHLCFCVWVIKKQKEPLPTKDVVALLRAYRPALTAGLIAAVAEVVKALRH